MSMPRREQIVFLLALAIASCGGGGGDTVTAPNAILTTLSVSLTPGSIGVGQSAIAVAAGFDQHGSPVALGSVAWSSGATSVATVSSTGVVVGVGPGQAAIIATSGGKQGQQSITVASLNVAAAITLQPTSLTIDVGQTAVVTATVRDASGSVLTNKTVNWLTSNAAIAGGTANGNSATIQGYAAGSAVISASVDAVTATLPVSVRVTAPKPVASVVVSPATASIAVGGSVPLVATLKDAQGNVLTDRTVAWTSSNLSVANGTASGYTAVIQGLAVGIATISATSEGVTGSAAVTVTSGTGSIPLTCSGLAGGQVFGADGQYLGRLTNQFDSQSILNTFGQYGSQFSSTSMYNTFSSYGSAFSSLSAYNTLASSPPLLFVGSQFAAYVSKNTIKTPRVDPDALHACAFP